MELCIKFTTFLYIFVERQVNYFSMTIQEKLASFDLKLSNFLVQFNKQS